MLSWARSQVKEHGAVGAARLIWQVGRAQVGGALADKFLPKRVACPCCGWEGNRFRRYVEAGFTGGHIECPRCYSHPRHRALYLWLRDAYGLRDKTGRALVFAPERSLAGAWETARRLLIIKTDIAPARGVDVLADIQRLPFAPDSFDLIWCHHVLTQVEDDRAALGELRRVLRPGSGELVLSATIRPGAPTEEFGHENKELLGFWRVYGDDFAGRVGEAGFAVRGVRYAPPAEECARYGIDPEEQFFVCTKPGGL